MLKQFSNILPVITNSFVYINSKTKYILNNFYYIDFLIIYNTITSRFSVHALVMSKKFEKKRRIK